MSAKTKPVGYQHPSVEWNGLTVTDLFCGAGGSSSGLVAAGYRVVIAANHWALAIESHQVNHPDDVRASREDGPWLTSGNYDERTAQRAVSNSAKRTRTARANVTADGTRTARTVERSSAGISTTRTRRCAALWSPAMSAISAAVRSGCDATGFRSSSRPITTTTPGSGAASCASGATKRSACSTTTRSCSARQPSTSRTLRDSSSSSRGTRTLRGAR